MDFNKFAHSYTSEVDRVTEFSGKSQDYYAKFKAELILELTRERFGQLTNVYALDVGCGVGITDAHLGRHLDHIYGVDPSAGSINEARERNPAAEYQHYPGGALPFIDNMFDVTFAICVFHHIDGPDHQEFMLKEMTRVTRQGGLVLVFEHNPWNPLTRFAVSRCKLDHDARLISARQMRTIAHRAGLDIVKTRHILLTPWQHGFWLGLERWASGLPFGAQYYLSGSPGNSAPNINQRSASIHSARL